MKSVQEDVKKNAPKTIALGEDISVPLSPPRLHAADPLLRSPRASIITDVATDTASRTASRKHAMTQGLFVLLAVFFALGGAIAVGALDLLIPEAQIRTPLALNSVILYWLLCSIVWVLATAWRRRWKQLTLSLATTLAALVVAEAGLRLTAVPTCLPVEHLEWSPQYHHVYPANTVMRWTNLEGRTVLIDTNADGLRTRYTRRSFRRHDQRIAVMGDSFTFGYGVRAEAALPHQLQGILRRATGRKDEPAVLNAGIISYSPILQRRQYEGIVRHYRPTLALLLIDATDISDDYTYARRLIQVGDKLQFERDEHFCPSYHGALYELVRGIPFLRERVVRPLALPFGRAYPDPVLTYNYYRFEITIGDTTEHSRYFIYKYPLSVTRPYFESTFGHIRAIASAVHDTGAGFVLVILPRYHHWSDTECPENAQAIMHPRDMRNQFEYFRFFEERRDQVDFPILNLLPSFQATDRYPLVFRRDFHFNEAGHAFAAEAIAHYLLEHGMIASDANSPSATAQPRRRRN